MITVLLKEPLPEGTLALRNWAEDKGFTRHGIDVRTERDLELSILGGSVLTYAGRGQLPREGLDIRNLPDDFDFGQSFVVEVARATTRVQSTRVAPRAPGTSSRKISCP